MKTRHLARKAMAGAITAAMAATMVVVAPAAAQAEESVNQVTAETAVTAAVNPASCVSVQMLGLSSVTDATSAKSMAEYDLTNAWYGSQYKRNGIYGSLKWILESSDTYHQSPDPLIANAVKGTGTSVIFGTPQNTGGTAAALPKLMIAEYGGSNAIANQVWNRLPDVITGCRVNKAGDMTTYKDSFNNSINLINGTATKEGVEPIAAAKGVYNPQIVDYNSDTFATIIDSAYRIADAAKNVVENSNGTKKLRFGGADSAINIMVKYEEVIKGMQGYVLHRLEQDGKDKKTIAVITGMEETSAGTVYTVAVEGSQQTTGMSELRCVEALKNTCNIATGDANNHMTLSDLEKVDFILINPAIYESSDQVAIADTLGSLKSKAYWCSTYGNGGTGSTRDTNSNNLEVGQTYARIISCVYSEYLDQSDMVAYWYENFLHVKSGKLGEVIAKAMSGIRNWDNEAQGVDYTTWTENTVKDYVESNVETKMKIGTAYLQTWSEDQFSGNAELLKLTSYVPAESLPTAAGKTAIKTLKAGKKKFTVAYKKVAAATGYQVTYSLKKNFKSATTKTVKKAATTKLTVKKLKSSKKYFVKVRTYKTIDGKAYYSAWSAKKAVKVK